MNNRLENVRMYGGRELSDEAAAILVLAEKVGELVEILESWKGRG